MACCFLDYCYKISLRVPNAMEMIAMELTSMELIVNDRLWHLEPAVRLGKSRPLNNAAHAGGAQPITRAAPSASQCINQTPITRGVGAAEVTSQEGKARAKLIAGYETTAEFAEERNFRHMAIILCHPQPAPPLNPPLLPLPPPPTMTVTAPRTTSSARAFGCGWERCRWIRTLVRGRAGSAAGFLATPTLQPTPPM